MYDPIKLMIFDVNGKRLWVGQVHLYPEKRSVVVGTKEKKELKALKLEGKYLLETNKKEDRRRDDIHFPVGTPDETILAALCDKIYNITEDPDPYPLP